MKKARWTFVDLAKFLAVLKLIGKVPSSRSEARGNVGVLPAA